VHFYYNYSSEPINFDYPHSEGLELVSEEEVNGDQSLILAPWDILIIEEN
jgi:beta-galactosidase